MSDLLQSLRLAHPAVLAALLLLPVLALASRASLAREPLARRLATLALRLLTVSLLVFALAGPVVVEDSDERCAVLLVDRSASISEGGAAAAKRYVEDAQSGAGPGRMVVVPFAATAGESADRLATDLAAGLEAAAAAAFPRASERTVLLSDGNATVAGNLLAAAAALQSPVDTVPLAATTGPETWIAAFDSPGTVRPGEDFTLQLTIRSDRPSRGEVVFLRDGLQVERREVAFEQREATVLLSARLLDEPNAEFQARLEGFEDTRPENNLARAIVWPSSPARALLVGKGDADFARLESLLRRLRIEPHAFSVEDLPGDAGGLDRYDLVVAANIPAAAFTPQQAEAIAAYVRRLAGGLLVIGGADSLTAGGYRDHPLEQLLPVACRYEARSQRPSLAIVLVIDQSGSMEEGGAIGLAQQAVRRTVEMLDARDELGVVAFQETNRWIAPLQPCTDKQKVLRQVDTLSAGGGTNMLPAIEKAHLALDESFADLKHIIVLTDGISYPGDFDALARGVAASGITISTVAIGERAAEPLLRTIAELGGGSFHLCRNARELPDVFARETAKAARFGIHEQPFLPAYGPALPQTFGKPPSLLGYVETKAKPAASIAMLAEAGDPLAAWWRCGAGTAAVFTSDLDGSWSRPWKTWSGWEPLWTTLVRQAIRPGGAGGWRLHARRALAATIVTVDAPPLGDRPEADVQVSLQGTRPDGERRESPMPRVAAGKYALETPALQLGTYQFTVTATIAGQRVFSGKTAVCIDWPDELAPRETNVALLKEIASATGGRFQPAAGQLLPPGTAPQTRLVPVWHCFLFAAILAFLADLAVRRLPAVFPRDPATAGRSAPSPRSERNPDPDRNHPHQGPKP